MCGICGVWNNRDQISISNDTIKHMTDALAHRGPDDSGYYFSHPNGLALGFRRLAIIDLSSAGHQPMGNEDDTIWIVFNGEIYNFAELRSQLQRAGHIFKSKSDTETIIHGYEEWGLQVVERLRGMFGFAMWDAKRKRLFLARDHTGIKPLFYYWDGRTFAFASEIKAFWALQGLDRSLDRSAIFDYLTYL